MIQIVSRMVHPNGVKYEYTVPRTLVKMHGQWHDVMDTKAERGVLITYPDGVKIWRPNSYYQ